MKIRCAQIMLSVALICVAMPAAMSASGSGRPNLPFAAMG
jgi:hypothetical protein